MPINFRQKVNFLSSPVLTGATLGSGGASIAEVLFGSASFLAASTTTGSTFVATVAVTGLNAGAALFTQAATGLAACTILSSACVSSAGNISASIRTTGSATSASSNVTISYFAIN